MRSRRVWLAAYVLLVEGTARCSFAGPGVQKCGLDHWKCQGFGLDQCVDSYRATPFGPRRWSRNAARPAECGPRGIADVSHSHTVSRRDACGARVAAKWSRTRPRFLCSQRSRTNAMLRRGARSVQFAVTVAGASPRLNSATV